MSGTLANLWMLKAPNGMFWYAIDYLRRLPAPVHVIVRPALAEVARQQLNTAPFHIEAGGVAAFVTTMFAAVSQGRLIYTPTPHPLPFIKRQVVTFHDAYPFTGEKGKFKRALFRWGVLSSGCRVAHINKRSARGFLSECKFPSELLLFAPNVPPLIEVPKQEREVKQKEVVVLGCFGTDSRKKRYVDLIQAIHSGKFERRLFLRIYGEDNDYVREIRDSCPSELYEIASPRRETLSEFITTLDGVISIAVDEGFGRPLAAAIAHGVPAYLIASETFEEFFSGAAIFRTEVCDLLAAAAALEKAPQVEELSGFLAEDYSKSVEDAVETLTSMAQRGAA